MKIGDEVFVLVQLNENYSVDVWEVATAIIHDIQEECVVANLLGEDFTSVINKVDVFSEETEACKERNRRNKENGLTLDNSTC